jgi:hypothetical protein
MLIQQVQRVVDVAILFYPLIHYLIDMILNDEVMIDKIDVVDIEIDDDIDTAMEMVVAVADNGTP